MQRQSIGDKNTGLAFAAALIKALAAALVLTVVLLALEAWVIKLATPSDQMISILSYVMRALTLGAGAFVFARCGAGKAWQRGTLLGSLYWGVFYLIHILTMQNTAQLTALLLDALFCIVAAFIFSILFAKH